MKKLILSLSVVLTFILYALVTKNSTQKQTLNPLLSTNGNPTPPSPAEAKPSTSLKTSPGPKPIAYGLYRDGTYVGQSANAYYGNVQVEAVIRGGQLTDVKFLDYPKDRSYSLYVSSQATPYLREEAIKTQNANVDIVSGATDTSYAFRESLASALAQAKN